jgi:hypothetical protein
LFKRCSTCFGQHFAHHQEHIGTAAVAFGSRIEAKVDVFLAVVCLLEKKHIHLGFCTGTGGCGCSSKVLLMMGKMLPETC